jgi:hypothetical protein
MDSPRRTLERSTRAWQIGGTVGLQVGIAHFALDGFHEVADRRHRLPALATFSA